MLRLLMILQTVGAVSGNPISSDFDLKDVKTNPEAGSIVVTARKRNQRIEREPVSTEPPLGRAEMRLFGKVKANVHVESQGMANGTTSQRVMVGTKIPF